LFSTDSDKLKDLVSLSLSDQLPFVVRNWTRDQSPMNDFDWYWKGWLVD
jgi:hypothetical protein